MDGAVGKLIVKRANRNAGCENGPKIRKPANGLHTDRASAGAVNFGTKQLYTRSFKITLMSIAIRQ